MFTDVFIRRPVLATVCSILITLAGAISIPTLPIGRYPELAPPTVAVSAFYTGANAQAVESAVTTPLESVINGVEGMLYMTSASTNNGLSTITVTFEVGRSPDLAAVDVQNRVNSALGFSAVAWTGAPSRIFCIPPAINFSPGFNPLTTV